MKEEKFDFYSKTSIKSYNLDESMRYQLGMLDSLDTFTRKHSENVANITCRICEYLNASNKFTVYCTTCAYLHDIGKLFIPPRILQKTSSLTDEEFEIMKTHTTTGYKMCMKDLKLRPYAAGALYHHESLDGSGYPNGLKQKDIPIEGQIIRVADEYDAIVSKRQYKSHVDISDTLEILIADSKPSSGHLVGKINKKYLKALIKVVIDDTEYEKYCVGEYINYLKENISRLKQIDKYATKMKASKKEKDKTYYENGVKLLLIQGENIANYKDVLEDYEQALVLRKGVLKKLDSEIKKIKKMKV
jgi:hypothetical protein